MKPYTLAYDSSKQIYASLTSQYRALRKVLLDTAINVALVNVQCLS